MTETPLDHAHAQMQADPDAQMPRLRFYDRLLGAELFVLLERPMAAGQDRIEPKILTSEGVSFVLAFDREERLAQFAGGAVPYAGLAGRGVVEMLAGQGIGLERTAVGDRYVVERMREGGFNLGGEQSGHIVMSDYATTGDGLMAGLHFLAEMVRSGQKASELAQQFAPVPQLLKNVRFAAGQTPLDTDRVQSAIMAAEKALEGNGRLLIRKSGTEPLVRVMAESEDSALLAETVDAVVAAVEAAVSE